MTTPDWLQQILELVGMNVWARAGAIVLVAVVLAKLVDWFLTGALRAWASLTKTDFDDKLIAAAHRPIFVSVVLVGAWLALLEIDVRAEYLDKLFLPMLKTLGLVMWSAFAFRLAQLLLDLASRHHERFAVINERTLPLFGQVARLIVFGAAFYFFCLSWNIPVTGWLASAGVVGLAVGFAAKDTLANLFSGIFILADAPYKVGDFIVLDSGERGQVRHIGLRSTRLLTRDDIEITVPNAVIANAKIMNESGGPWEKERFRLRVGVAYGSDLDQVRDVLMAVALEQPDVLDEPEPRVRIRAFGDSSIDHELLGWIEEPVLRGRVVDDLHRRVYRAFAEAGIVIPFPQREIAIKQPPAGD
ncbi:MAG: mechanosensitive ion channel family protein [Acidobacteriota bacterium]|nr:mechanosensitive ion channel family protein [Acidobacteriota bacterium]MDH3522167.1 mechanosensitive ion channel family protein [Acidobacteriota bacterium]